MAWCPCNRRSGRQEADPKEISRSRDHGDPNSPGSQVFQWATGPRFTAAGERNNEPQLPGPPHRVRTHPDPWCHEVHANIHSPRLSIRVLAPLPPACVSSSPPPPTDRVHSHVPPGGAEPRCSGSGGNKQRNASHILLIDHSHRHCPRASP